MNPAAKLLDDSSLKTLEAIAQVIRALAPEVTGVSFHDTAAETLWMSDDFLLPEDHQLVSHALACGVNAAGVNAGATAVNAAAGAVDASARGGQDIHYGRHEGGGRSLAIATRDSENIINGAVRLSVDTHNDDARTVEPLEDRLAPILVCLATEFERRQVVPNLPPEDAARLAQVEKALNALRFELYLQPFRSLQADGGMAHYEVLLRLRMFDGTLLEPGAFLRTAADRNLMPAIDRWVLRTLLVWLVNNRKRWARVPAGFSINVSPQSMTDVNFVSYVESCILKSGLPPQALCFEVTERMASSGSISVAESMRRLEALGCEVALDDFGTNAPSYGYLRAVPAHYFKIDGSLVLAAPTDRVARAVISSIVRMAEDLGVQTVAESVESDSELEAMRSLGVDFAQGYLFGRPSALAGYDFDQAA